MPLKKSTYKKKYSKSMKQYKKKSTPKSKSKSNSKSKSRSHKKYKKVSKGKKTKKNSNKKKSKKQRGGSKYVTLTPSEYYSVKHSVPHTIQSTYNKFEGKALPSDPNPTVQNLQEDLYDISPSDDLIV